MKISNPLSNWRLSQKKLSEIDEVHKKIDIVRERLHKREKKIDKLSQKLDSVFEKTNLLTSVVVQKMSKDERSKEVSKLEKQTGELAVKFDTYIKLQTKDLKTVDILLDTSTGLLGESVASSAKFGLFAVTFELAMLLTLATFFGIVSPEFGWDINKDYYVTIATILPILFIASYIETGRFSEEYPSNLTKFNEICGTIVPSFLGIVFCLTAIEGHSTTFLRIMSFGMLVLLMTDFVLTMWFAKPIKSNLRSRGRS